MPPALSEATRNTIIQLCNQKLSISMIHTKTGVSQSQISKICSANCPEVHKSKGGHPSLLSPIDIRYTTHLVETGQANTATQVHDTLKDTFLRRFSVQTICRALKRAGMLAVTKKKQPQLTKRHRVKQYAFALAHRVGSDGRKWVWKKRG